MSHRFGHMLGIEPLSTDEIVFLLDQSKLFQEIQRHPLKKLATLRGKTVALAFFEPSTRTRISFATAASRLGADQSLTPYISRMTKRQTCMLGMPQPGLLGSPTLPIP